MISRNTGLEQARAYYLSEAERLEELGKKGGGIEAHQAARQARQTAERIADPSAPAHSWLSLLASDTPES